MHDKNLLPLLGAITLKTIQEDYARIAVLVILTLLVAYLIATHQTIPPELLAIYSAVLGYYFGRGVNNASRE